MALARLADITEPLVAPALVAAFDGWVDAAGAATTAAAHAADGGDVVVTFDGDLIYDYRSRRPVLDIIDGTLTEITWYDLAIRRARVGGRDLLVMWGAEPDFRWRELGNDVVDLALRLGVTEWI